MGKFLTALAAGFLSVQSLSAITISFSGQSHPVIDIIPEKSTGLDMLYVLYDTLEVNEMRISGFNGNLTVSKYSNLGGGYAESVPVRFDGAEAIVDTPEGNMGYIIDDSGKTSYIWVVNYKPHQLKLQSVHASNEQYCDNTRLDIEGSGDAIAYYTIDGRKITLSREIEVNYSNLEWNEDSDQFEQQSFTKTITHLSNPVVLTPPLYCNSTVTVAGDRFLKEWGIGETITSGVIYANGVDSHTTAEQVNLPYDGPDAPASNMIKTETQGMGGSAPADIEFRAYVTDAVIHNEWQIASDHNFDYIEFRFNEQNLDYSFTDEGTYYVRYVGSNSDGSCETIGETYTVSIGASDLRIPNAFTPNDDGVNDEWKVAYRSLLSFKCTIFDRYGNEIISFDDPSKGWDGKYKGKLVKPGVYFYVIEARGADGKKYKKGGDINIIKSKRYSNSDTGTM